MMETLKPGEYIGADGATYLFRDRGHNGVKLETTCPATSYPAFVPVADLRAAAAALIALADETETEMAEWGEEPHRYRLVTRPGTTHEVLYTTIGTRGSWVEVGPDYPGCDIIAAYRAGRKRGKDAER